MKFKKVRKAIKEKDLTINRVAIEAGITPSSLYAAFNGKVDFFPGWKKRVADVLGESVDSLFSEGCEADECLSFEPIENRTMFALKYIVEAYKDGCLGVSTLGNAKDIGRKTWAFLPEFDEVRIRIATAEEIEELTRAGRAESEE